jgi:hypothetical protein
MRRVLVAECIHEVCSFNPVPTRYGDFAVAFGGRGRDRRHGADHRGRCL